MTKAAPVTDRRVHLIKLIHVARRDLERSGKMDEPTYRTMLRTAGGKDSTALMDVAALERVLAQAKLAGFRVRSKVQDRRQDTSAEARKVRALWLFLHALGTVKNPAETALAAYVKRIAHVDDLHWADGDAMTRLIETLKQWAMRDSLPQAVRQLQDQVQSLAATAGLAPQQLEAHRHAQALLQRPHQTFNICWRAWDAYSTILGQQLADDVRATLGNMNEQRLADGAQAARGAGRSGRPHREGADR
ncbi:phage protein GemA/Gp16 family protein [Variovorax sp.]|uniref:phage protein GemA/Gp16 family protein n=1 Tax=Variovorax sp. TaxID=1871043 RepID=UPI003BAA2B9A